MIRLTSNRFALAVALMLLAEQAAAVRVADTSAWTGTAANTTTGGGTAQATADGGSSLNVTVSAAANNYIGMGSTTTSGVSNTLNGVESTISATWYTPNLSPTTSYHGFLTNVVGTSTWGAGSGTGGTLFPACRHAAGTAIGSILSCNNINGGVPSILTLAFEHPVVDPVIHVSRLGGFFNNNVVGTSFNTWASFRLTTPGVTLSLLNGNGQLAVSGADTITHAPFTATNLLGVNCGSGTGTRAGCGSVQVSGTPVASLSFEGTFNVQRQSGTAAQDAATTNLYSDGMHWVVTLPEDYGDAPDTYNQGNAATHILTDLRLGSAVTADNPNVINTGSIASSPLASPGATTDAGDDGATVPSTLPMVAGSVTQIPVTLSGVSKAAVVCGWIDYNRDGDLADTGERATNCVAVPAGATTASLSFTAPTAIIAGTTYARIRVSYDSSFTVAAAAPTGSLDSGETEDYALSIVQPSFGTCDARMFLDQVSFASSPGQSTLYNVGYAGTPFTYTSLGSGLAYNAMGYNPLDNYIYGIEWDGTTGNELIRIGSDGSTVNLGVIAGLPVANYGAGVIAPNGDHYVSAANNILYRINIATRTATAITLSRSVPVFDMVWYGGMLYSIESGGQLIRIDPATGAVTTIGSSPPITLSIAMWGFNNGIFAYNGSNNSIYSIDPLTGAATLISSAPAAANADGANCPTPNIQFNADLSVTKTNTPTSGPSDLPGDTYAPGATRTYTIVVTNTSTSFGAQNVLVSDPVPAGVDVATMSWTCTSTSGGARCGAASGSGALNDTGLDLPPGAVATYLVTMTVPAGFAGDLSNTVTLTPPSTINDANAANNTATDVDQSAPLLTLRKISIGGVDSFGFTGTNGVATQTLLTATAGTPVAGATQALTAASTVTTITESTTPVTYRVTDITCTGLGAGGTASPDLANRTVSLDAAATAAGANIVCTFTNTLQQTDIQVVKTATPNPVVSGDVVTYTLVVSNNGPSAASNVLLTDSASAGQTCTTPSTTATCTATGGASCPSPTVPVTTLLGSGMTIPSLPVGGQVSITLQCTVTASGQ
ncbi:MAG: GEVED domain-containing protein [Pseudoxanthomonas sp.]